MNIERCFKFNAEKHSLHNNEQFYDLDDIKYKILARNESFESLNSNGITDNNLNNHKNDKTDSNNNSSMSNNIFSLDKSDITGLLNDSILFNYWTQAMMDNFVQEKCITIKKLK